MIDHGLNWSQQNRIKALISEGYEVTTISRLTNCSERLVRNCLGQANDQSTTADKYGPLRGSPEWESLSPGERSGLTRKRNAGK